MAVSSRQSPAVMSRTRPPLAATIAAIRRSDRSRVSGLTCSASHARRSAAKAPGSRVRAISLVSSCRPELASSHPGSGLIRSPQIIRSSPAPRPLPRGPPAGALPAAESHPAAISRQPAPAWPAPEAAQRSCHVPPGCPPSQSRTCPRIRPRCCWPPRLPSRNGGAVSSARASSLPTAVPGHQPGRSLGGNCRITCAPSGAEGPGQTRVNRDDDVSPAGAAALTRPSRTGPARCPAGSRQARGPAVPAGPGGRGTR